MGTSKVPDDGDVAHCSRQRGKSQDLAENGLPHSPRHEDGCKRRYRDCSIWASLLFCLVLTSFRDRSVMNYSWGAPILLPSSRNCTSLKLDSSETAAQFSEIFDQKTNNQNQMLYLNYIFIMIISISFNCEIHVMHMYFNYGAVLSYGEFCGAHQSWGRWRITGCDPPIYKISSPSCDPNPLIHGTQV